MEAVCNSLVCGGTMAAKQDFSPRTIFAIHRAFGSTYQRLHFGDKSSPDSCSGVQITLVRCLTSSIPPQTKIVARTAVSCRLRSKTPCNCHETDGFGHPNSSTPHPCNTQNLLTLLCSYLKHSHSQFNSSAIIAEGARNGG